MVLREGRCRVCGAKGPLTAGGAVRVHTGRDGFSRCPGSGRKPAADDEDEDKGGGRGPVTPARLSGLRVQALSMATAWKPWHEREGMRDEGSCVSGNGISVQVMLPRKRKPRRAMVVENADIGYQSEQRHFFELLLARLSELHPDVAFEYEHGSMS